MNKYEEKLEARKARYEELAQKNHDKSNSAYSRVHQISEHIPLGQPILVGHHSEKRHRADIQKIDNIMRSSVEAQKKAAYYESKAAAVGKGGISSDDPDAIKKLEDKLLKLEKKQEYMKAVNKAFKKGDDALKALGLSETEISTYKKVVEDAYSWNKQPFPSFELNCNSANIRSTKARIEELKRTQEIVFDEVLGNGFRCYLDKEENRVCFDFDTKPNQEIIDLLKQNAFNWSRFRGEWIRKATANCIWITRKLVMPKLLEL